MTMTPEERAALLALAEKATPGPLEASDPGDYGDYDGDCIVILGDDRRRIIVLGSGEQSRADAAMIVAAYDRLPALLAALAAAEADRDAAAMDADMQRRETGNMEHNARVFIQQRDAARAEAARLREAGYRGLNYIENTESELGITLGCGDALRAALAPATPGDAA